MPVPAWIASLMNPFRCLRKMASLSGLAPCNTPAMPSGCIPMLVRFSNRLSVGPSVHEKQISQSKLSPPHVILCKHVFTADSPMGVLWFCIISQVITGNFDAT